MQNKEQVSTVRSLCQLSANRQLQKEGKNTKKTEENRFRDDFAQHPPTHLLYH